MTRLAAAQVMSERELQERVRRHCLAFGVFHYHPHYSARSEPGWPDSVIVGSRILYRELKTERGSLTPAQRDLGRLLLRAGADWKVWRPRDLLSGLIADELRRISGVQAELFDARRTP